MADSEEGKVETATSPTTESLDQKITRRQAISTVGKIAIGVAAVAVVGGATYYLERPTTPSVNEVRIGCPFPLSGPIASIGLDSQAMAQIFADKINSQGGIKSLGGAKLTLVFVDNEGKPDVGRTQTRHLIDDLKVSVLQDGFFSGIVLTESEEAEKSGIPMVVGSSSNTALTQRGFKYFFRAWLPDSKLALNQFQFLKELEAANPQVSVKNIAIVTDDSLFGTGAGKWYTAANGDSTVGGYNLVQSITFPQNATDLTSEVLKLRGAAPDVIFTAIGGVNDAILLQDTLKKYSVDFDLMFSSAGHLNPAYQKLGNEAFFPVTRDSVTPDELIAKPWIKTWADAFTAKTGSDLYAYPADTWTCLNIIRDALERAASTDPTKIRDAIAATNLGPNDCMELYPGIKFDSTGENTLARSVMIQLLGDNVWHLVGPRDAALYKPVFPQPTWSQRAAGQIPQPVKY